MERKTKNRILGTIVMAALVIALLPLFHSSNTDIKPDLQTMNAPPFPDQGTQVSDSANPEFKTALANQTSPIPFKTNPDDNGVNQLPDDTINPNTSKAYNNINKAAPPAPMESKAQPGVKQPSVSDDDDDLDAPVTSSEKGKSSDKAIDGDIKSDAAQNTGQDTESIFRNSLETELQEVTKPTAKKVSHPVKAHEVATPKMKQAQVTPRKKGKLPLDDNGLFKLKNSAWVIQLGSYKNKSYAMQLVNKLRAKGYSAFIQQASVGTSVYVGPETKEDVARSIAARLELEMKLQGFVISYKPLTI